jgi:hypothetical protein
LPLCYLIIITLCLVSLGVAAESTSDWPIVTDKSTGIELEFPGEFAPMPPVEGISFGGQSPDGIAAMAVISSPEGMIQSPEDMLATAMSSQALTQMNPAAREALSAEDAETFQVESGFRQEFIAQREGKPINGVLQYIVYRKRAALIIVWCIAEQWEIMRPILLFSLDTTYIW